MSVVSKGWAQRNEKANCLVNNVQFELESASEVFLIDAACSSHRAYSTQSSDGQ